VPLGGRAGEHRAQSDVGVVDGNVQIGLIVQACGLIAGRGTGRVLFLRGIDFVTAGRRIKNCRAGGENRKSGKSSKTAESLSDSWGSSSLSPRSGFAFSLRTMGAKNSCTGQFGLGPSRSGCGRDSRSGRRRWFQSSWYSGRSKSWRAAHRWREYRQKSSDNGEETNVQCAPPSVVRRMPRRGPQSSRLCPRERAGQQVG